MIFDTDILIWIERGHERAARLVDQSKARYISVQTYMELLQGAAHKSAQQVSKDFLVQYGFEILPFSEAIGHRALVYIEEYSLGCGLRAGDAVIAATAAEHNLPLVTGNAKHFRMIKELKLKIFRP